MVDLDNDSMLEIGGGDKTLMKGHSCYTDHDSAEVTLRHSIVVFPVST